MTPDDPLHTERQEQARWFAERPARADADYYEPTPYDWPFRQVTTDPDPWNRQCDRCMEFFEEPGCAHGLVLCPTCAPFGCQTCACEEADAAARAQEIYEEWWK